MANTTDLIQEFQEVTHEEYHSFSYSSGYLGSMLSQVLMELPKHRQAEYVNQLKAHIEKSRSDIAIRNLSSSLGA